MKKTILLLLTMLSLNTYAQKDSTLTPEQAINFMANELTLSHKEYRTGVIITFIGGLVTATSFTDAAIDNKNNLLMIGGIVGLLGTYFMIDSHRHIGKAGKVYLTPNGIGIRLN